VREDTRKLIERLGNMTSPEAAALLIESGEVPPGAALLAIPHISWRRPERLRLAEHFLQNLPHANPSAYRSILQIVSVAKALEVVEQHMPEKSGDRTLLFYYLLPELQKTAKGARDEQLIAAFQQRYQYDADTQKTT
jgi:hypothetical protein